MKRASNKWNDISGRELLATSRIGVAWCRARHDVAAARWPSLAGGLVRHSPELALHDISKHSTEFHQTGRQQPKNDAPTGLKGQSAHSVDLLRNELQYMR